jgi:F420-non-reducing hydrogenase iron-sulfur subunit
VKTKAVIFFCNWSNYPGPQLSEWDFGESNTEAKMMVSMCSGRISPELIMEIFSRGAWGVMIAACPADQCEHDGNYRTCGRVSLLKKMFQQLGLESERLRLTWIDKGEVVAFEKAVEAFVDDVQKLGPLPIAGSRA